MDCSRQIFDGQTGHFTAAGNRLLESQWQMGETNTTFEIPYRMPMMRQIHRCIAQIGSGMIRDARRDCRIMKLGAHFVQGAASAVGNRGIMNDRAKQIARGISDASDINRDRLQVNGAGTRGLP
jgi:hypothetical protein